MKQQDNVNLNAVLKKEHHASVCEVCEHVTEKQTLVKLKAAFFA